MNTLLNILNLDEKYIFKWGAEVGFALITAVAVTAARILLDVADVIQSDPSQLDSGEEWLVWLATAGVALSRVAWAL